MKTKLVLTSVFVSLILAGLFASAALAGDALALLYYKIDFIEVVIDPVTSTSTWTYAITSSPLVETALSHWTLDLGNCGYEIVAPENYSYYTTPSSYLLQTGTKTGIDLCAPSGPLNCQSAVYQVEYGKDATTGLSGLKFQDGSIQLDATNLATHIFSFTLYRELPPLIDDTAMAIKIGEGQGSFATGYITGPACSPSAVELLSFSGTTQSGSQSIAILALATLGLVVGGIGVTRLHLR